MPDVERELQKPLDPKHVKTRSQAGQTLSYIEAWHAIAEANRIFGHLGWQRDTVSMDLVSQEINQKGNHVIGYVAKVRITVYLDNGGRVSREGTGYGSGISKNLGDAHEGAVKESESDAMKRAFMTFGHPLGLALYDKERTHVQEFDGRTPEQKKHDEIAEASQKFVDWAKTSTELKKLEGGVSKKQDWLLMVQKEYPEMHALVSGAIADARKRLSHEA